MLIESGHYYALSHMEGHCASQSVCLLRK